MKQFGVILRTIRKDRALSLRQAASLIGRSTGWLCELESGKPSVKCSQKEFERIMALYGIEFNAKRCGYLFKTNQTKSQKRGFITFDGAILKYLRTQSKLSLEQAAQKNSLSKGYLSKLENGLRPVTPSLRDQLLNSYGYKPSSFRNFSTKDKRGERVPVSYKLNILIQSMTQEQINSVFDFAYRLTQESTESGKTAVKAEDKTKAFK